MESKPPSTLVHELIKIGDSIKGETEIVKQLKVLI